MTDNEIIKTLECCNVLATGSGCKDCPLYNFEGTCSAEMINQTLDLINRQKAEIERLKKLLAESEAREMKAAKHFYKEGVKDFVKRLKSIYTSDKRYERPCTHTLLTMLFHNIDKVSKDLAGDNDA